MRDSLVFHTDFLSGHGHRVQWLLALLAVMDAYPHVRAWLARSAAWPGFVPMRRCAVGLRA